MTTRLEASEEDPARSPNTDGVTAGDDGTFIPRNYYLGIINGTLVHLGNAFVDPPLVLSGYVYELTRSSGLVGLLVALASAGMLWPQLPASSFIERRRRKLPFYRKLLLPRLIALGTIIVAMRPGGPNNHSWLLIAFFVAFFVYMTSRGAGVAPFFDVVGRTIRPTRLGGFFAWRSLFGDGTAFVAGFLVIQPVIIHVGFPTNYALLVGIGTAVLAAGWVSFCFMKELPDDGPQATRSLRETIAAGRRELDSNANYRRLLALRMLFRVNVLAMAFYVPFGVERLGAVGLGGVLVGTISASRVISSHVWGKLSERRGNRVCFLGAGVGFSLAPLGALIAPHLPALFTIATPGGFVVDARLAVYIAALATVGLSMQGNMIATSAFLIESAPHDRRASYVAFLNAVSFPLTALPAIAGALIGAGILSLELLFGLIAVSGVATLAVSFRLREVRGTPSARMRDDVE